MSARKIKAAPSSSRTTRRSGSSKTVTGFTGLLPDSGLRQVLEITRAPAALLDKEGKLLAVNPAFKSLLQNPGKAATVQDLLSPAARASFTRLLHSAGRTTRKAFAALTLVGAGRFECHLIALKRGRFLFFAEPLAAPTGILGKYNRLSRKYDQVAEKLRITSMELNKRQTEVRAVTAQADEVSHTDALTLLPNRRQVIGDLQREVMSAERYGTSLAISMIDIDHFKRVNDTFGHAAGDDVLRAVALRLREQIRNPDLIGRYGGEEFLVILPNSSVRAASEQASRLGSYLRLHRIESGGTEVRVTISIGIAGFRLHQDSWQSLLARADEALYRAKNNGRDQWAAVEV